MPALLGLSLTAWLYERTAGRGVALAEALESVSHDRLTRLLQGDWSGHTRLERVFRPLVVSERGSRLSEETGIPQPCATASESLAGVCSRQERQPVDGFSRGFLVWTHGPRRIPLGLRVWRQGAPSTSDVALAWRSDARPRRRCRPEDGRCGAW